MIRMFVQNDKNCVHPICLAVDITIFFSDETLCCTEGDRVNEHCCKSLQKFSYLFLF